MTVESVAIRRDTGDIDLRAIPEIDRISLRKDKRATVRQQARTRSELFAFDAGQSLPGE